LALTFEKLSHDGTCDVCGAQGKVVVLASSMGPISYAYCKTCCEKGLEPYAGMVAYLSICDYPEGVRSEVMERVQGILKELGKTEEEFIKDCKAADEEYRQYIENTGKEET
jgi:predicted HicB family RNase H-like nuclease